MWNVEWGMGDGGWGIEGLAGGWVVVYVRLIAFFSILKTYQNFEN